MSPNALHTTEEMNVLLPAHTLKSIARPGEASLHTSSHHLSDTHKISFFAAPTLIKLEISSKESLEQLACYTRRSLVLGPLEMQPLSMQVKLVFIDLASPSSPLRPLPDLSKQAPSKEGEETEGVTPTPTPKKGKEGVCHWSWSRPRC
jgi:hypothetical protein